MQPTQIALAAHHENLGTFSGQAEAEIRSRVTEHWRLVAQVEKLNTDVAHWRQRAELAEAEIVVLVGKLKASDADRDKLKAAVTAFHTQFDTGAKIWLNAYERLANIDHDIVKVETPKQLEVLNVEAPQPEPPQAQAPIRADWRPDNDFTS